MSTTTFVKNPKTGMMEISTANNNNSMPDLFDNISNAGGFKNYDPNASLSTNGYQTLRKNQAAIDNKAPSYDMANSQLDASLKSDNLALQNANLKSSTDYMNSQKEWATGANTIKWDDVNGLGDFGSWLTGNRGGGSNYLDTGLKGLSTAATLYSAYNDNKYKGKMSDIAQQAQDLQSKQYALYEQQVSKQNAKSDAAQAAYDRAQNMQA